MTGLRWNSLIFEILKKTSFISSIVVSVVTYILLLSFLVVWNINNYQLEKKELFEKVADQVDIIYAGYTDSIYFAFIKDIQSDTTESITKIISSYGFLDNNEEELNWINGSNPPNEEYNIEIKINDTSNGLTIDMKQSNTDTTSGISSHASGKHIISKVKIKQETINSVDSTKYVQVVDTKDTKIEKQFKIQTDSYDLNNNHFITSRYANNLDQEVNNKLQELGINAIIASRFLGEEKPKQSQSIGFNNEKNDPYLIKVKHFTAYLLSQIMPSLILSILLAIIILFSFLFLFYHWKKQSDLIEFKNEFTSNMTLELKTPIATIGVALEAIENFGIQDIPEKRKEYIGIANHELKRLNTLVDSVLNISSYDEKNNQLVLEDLDLKQLTNSVIQSLQLQIEKVNAKLIIKFDNEPAPYLGDRIHLTNVLINIIDNAIKYASKDPQITIDIQDKKSVYLIQVSDNGMGIESRYISKVFDRYFRAPQYNVHDVKGNGLGLNYVRSIIRKHGGQVELTSIINNGTTVTLKIPK